MSRKAVVAALFLIAFSGCTLYKEVSISPLLLTPANIERGADLTSMMRRADFLRAIETAATIDARPRPSATDLAALGNAYLAAGRLDEGRKRLRAALDLDPYRQSYADIAWSLSQLEFLANNFESALEWANIASDQGLNIRQWHLDYLQSLRGTPVYRFSGSDSERLHFRFGRPDVPRVPARANGREVEAVIDSGAVLSIISENLATTLPVRSLGKFRGTFYGLLGEPISVRFGMIDKLELGDLVVENVPVAIMPDEKMRFLVNKREGKQFHMDLLLGTNLLKEFRLELNFDRRSVTFTRLTPADRVVDANQNLFYNGFRPHVRGAVNRHGWFLFVLDTGSEITFLNQSRLGVLPIRIFGKGGHSATLQGLGGAMKHGAKLDNVEIGIDKWAGMFKTIPMYTGDEKDYAVGIVGQNMLENFNVVIDFGRMRVDLERR